MLDFALLTAHGPVMTDMLHTLTSPHLLCATDWTDYALVDSGHGRKLERFGKVTLDRPCAQAVWNPSKPALWEQADAFFTRKQGLE